MSDVIYRLLEAKTIGMSYQHKDDACSASMPPLRQLDYFLAEVDEVFKEKDAAINQSQLDLEQCKADHADMVQRNAALRDRPDIPTERVKSVQALVDKLEKANKDIQVLAEALSECVIELYKVRPIGKDYTVEVADKCQNLVNKYKDKV